MRKNRLTVIALILAVGMMSCSKPVYRQTAEQWLSGTPGTSSYNVSGQWRGPDSHGYNYWTGYQHTTFGSMVLVQEGTRIKGTYAEYDVIGTINGAEVTLFGIYGDQVYYTWHFTYSPDAKILSGRMCDGYYPKVEPHCYPISLDKI